MRVLLVPAILSNQAVEEEYSPDAETRAFSTVVFVLTATWSPERSPLHVKTSNGELTHPFAWLSYRICPDLKLGMVP